MYNPSLFNLTLPLIKYTAEIVTAKDIYLVDNSGTKTISPVNIFFKTWTREGVEFAKDKGSTPDAYINIDLLEKIKLCPFTIEKAINGLNVTYNNRGQAEVSEDDILKALVASGETIFDILDKSKK